MAKKRKEYEDDDGRTIADMSDLSRPSMLFWHFKGHDDRRKDQPMNQPFSALPEEKIPAKTRMWYMLGALKAALLIALAFIVGLGLLVLLMLLIWGAF